MIFTETREGRRFVGDLDPGTQLVEVILGLCKTHRISSGELRVLGWLDDVTLRSYSPTKGVGEPEPVAGPCHVVSLQGNVSLLGDAPVVVLHALLVGKGRAVHDGLLDGGRVLSAEFVLDSFDDLTLHRIRDKKLKLDRWLDLTINEVGNAPDPGVATEHVRSGREAMEAMPSRLLDKQIQYDLKQGDYLEHPRLGRCEVIHVIDDERLSIRLESGRVAQLHLGLLRLVRQGRAGTRHVFAVEVRRKV